LNSSASILFPQTSTHLLISDAHENNDAVGVDHLIIRLIQARANRLDYPVFDED